ncbi:ASTN2 protein, partial [Atractosteus spatula]|nr:ASTN2 protein [Atractosteus spatula]
MSAMQRLWYKLAGSPCISSKAGEERTGIGMAARVVLSLNTFLLLGLLLTRTCEAGGSRGTGMLAEERDRANDVESPCEIKTVTVSTLPVLRENEFSFTGGGAGSPAGGGAGESRLLLFVRTDLPGRISVLDDLDNTALPYFTLGKLETTIQHILHLTV